MWCSLTPQLSLHLRVCQGRACTGPLRPMRDTSRTGLSCSCASACSATSVLARRSGPCSAAGCRGPHSPQGMHVVASQAASVVNRWCVPLHRSKSSHSLTACARPTRPSGSQPGAVPRQGQHISLASLVAPHANSTRGEAALRLTRHGPEGLDRARVCWARLQQHARAVQGHIAQAQDGHLVHLHVRDPCAGCHMSLLPWSQQPQLRELQPPHAAHPQSTARAAQGCCGPCSGPAAGAQSRGGRCTSPQTRGRTARAPGSAHAVAGSAAWHQPASCCAAGGASPHPGCSAGGCSPRRAPV